MQILPVFKSNIASGPILHIESLGKFMILSGWKSTSSENTMMPSVLLGFNRYFFLYSITQLQQNLGSLMSNSYWQLLTCMNLASFTSYIYIHVTSMH